MNFEDHENRILAQLQAQIDPTNTGAIIFGITPETQKEFEDLRLKGKPIIVLCYQESDYEKSRSTDFISQAETESYDVLIRASILRGDLGIYDLVDKVRKAIVGFSLPGCTPIYLVKLGLYERRAETQEWIWKLRFVFDSAFAQVDFRSPVPLLSNLTLNDNSFS